MLEQIQIFSFHDNEQLMLALHETCEVKQIAPPYLRGRRHQPRKVQPG